MEAPIIAEIRPQDYPDLFRTLQPATSLWVQGLTTSFPLLGHLPERGFGVVGSRVCQNRSLHLVQNTLEKLRGSNLIIVSGLAKGIDAQAHEQAIAHGIPTIAVLGCGVDVSYPLENDPLKRKIIESGGLVVSEFALGSLPIAFHFIQRNRLIAGWSQAVWIVEAGFRSGAINTASWAKRHERTCYVTPCYPDDFTLGGNQRLLESEQLEEGLVRPFWGAQSLGETWLDLNGKLFRRRDMVRSKHVSSVLDKISESTTATGGISMDALREWSVQKKILPDLFHRQLQTALEQGNIEVRKGIFIRKLDSDSTLNAAPKEGPEKTFTLIS